MTPEQAVGLDLSLTSTGWSTSSGTGVIASKSKGMQRLVDIELAVWEVLDTVESPMVAVEGYAFAKRSSHAHAQGELGGVIRKTLYESSIPWVEIPPTSRAKFATGKGNAGKSEVVSAVSVRSGILWSGKGADDECDAWVLREMVLARFDLSIYDWPKVNMEALDKLDWSPFD